MLTLFVKSLHVSGNWDGKMVDSNNGDDDSPEVDTPENLWTEKLESYFVCLMVDEIAKGTMQATTFANAAWEGIAEALRKKTGKEYTYYQLKNKYHNLRARWSDFSTLLSEKEIQYDSVTGEVTATEDVWRRLYTRYRRAKTFRKKGLKDYDKLCVIFGCPETQSFNVYDGYKDNGYDDTRENGDANRAKRNERLPSVKASSRVTMGDRTKKKPKLEKKTSFTASLDSVADSGDGQQHQQHYPSSSKAPAYSGDVHKHQIVHFEDVVSCMEALNALEGINGALYAKATRYIHDDPLWRKMFLCMPDDRKKDWVINI